MRLSDSILSIVKLAMVKITTVKNDRNLLILGEFPNRLLALPPRNILRINRERLIPAFLSSQEVPEVFSLPYRRGIVFGVRHDGQSSQPDDLDYTEKTNNI